MLLEQINGPESLKALSSEELDALAGEIREFLIDHISKTGGHLASNLGVVELTIALHLALDLPKDKIIWDVGHQSYTHKLLTGRREGFDTLRQFGGMSGFPKRKESACDCFDTGHSSTSISAGLGLVLARNLTGGEETIVSVIGDGALTGGMAYEAMNNAARLKTNFVIVLNDNEMSISENIGGVSRYLSGIRTAAPYTDLKDGVEKTLSKMPVIGEPMIRQIRKTKSGIKQLVIPGMMFENMGLTYLGPVNGHSISEMVKILKEAKRYPGAVLVHVKTKKGKGYEPAERNPVHFHGVEPFDKTTGKPLKEKKLPAYTDVFSYGICKIAGKDPKVVAVTAAMPEGTGLKKFKKQFPERFFDVGIAEEHGVTFAAGMAAGGLKPVVAVYSSFLQRAYDQILHDVCIQNQHVVFAVDRAGLVGADGETHQGIFDLSYLSSIPNMTVMAPKNQQELLDMLEYGVNFTGPIAIRYPRGTAYQGLKEFRSAISLGRGEWLYYGKDIALLAVGSMVETAVLVKEKLEEKGFCPSVINARFVKPFDKALLDDLSASHRLLVTMEENVRRGGFGEGVAAYLEEKKSSLKLLSFSLPDDYIEHGSVEELKKMLGLDPNGIGEAILRYMDEDKGL